MASWVVMRTVDYDNEERALRDAVSKIASSFGSRRYASHASTGAFPLELWDELSVGGFAGVNIAVSDGGSGGSLRDLAAVAEEVAAAGCPLMMLVVSPAVCAPVLAAFGTDEQRARWLPGLGSGSERMALAVTEAEAGSNSHRVALRAARCPGGGWDLTGEKQFISGADEAANLLVLAHTGAGERGRGETSLFVVPTDSAGLTLRPIPMLVRAAERQFTVTFDRVAVSSDHLIGKTGDGLRQLFVGLNPERILSAATCVGLGRFALDRATAYAKERDVWGVPIGAHQAVAHPLARAFIAVESATLLVRRAIELLESGRDCGAVANMAKFSAAEAASSALDAAIQTHGGNGLTEEYGLAGLWGITRMYGIAPISKEMVLNHVAIHELGLPKGY